jgi:hypothetical protein
MDANLKNKKVKHLLPAILLAAIAFCVYCVCGKSFR